MKYLLYSFLASYLLVSLTLQVSPGDVTYIFYNRQYFNGKVIHYNEDPNFVQIRYVFNPTRPTILLIHGWQDNFEADSNSYVRQSILSKLDANIIKVDWHPHSHQGYFAARDAVPGIGQLASELLREISNKFHYSLNNVYIVGFSLGAHIAGNIGKKLIGQIGTIIGLDPAGPFISSEDIQFSLHFTDALYVQVIHTNGNTLGMIDPIGHSDYYPNGGSRQPGCGIDLVGGCAHNRAWEFFSESITNNNFVATRCESWAHFLIRNCNGQNHMMGGLTSMDKSAKGIFFLETNNASPYGRG